MIIDIHRHYNRDEGDLERYMERADSIGIEKVGMSTCAPPYEGAVSGGLRVQLRWRMNSSAPMAPSRTSSAASSDSSK